LSCLKQIRPNWSVWCKTAALNNVLRGVRECFWPWLDLKPWCGIWPNGLKWNRTASGIYAADMRSVG
jgi:hypothetical protein